MGQWENPASEFKRSAPQAALYPDQQRLPDIQTRCEFEQCLRRMLALAPIASGEQPLELSECFEKASAPPKNDRVIQALVTARVLQWCIEPITIVKEKSRQKFNN